MQVQCTICDIVEDIDDNCLQAKRLRNRRIYMYLCDTCYDRVTDNTEKRLATGEFRLYRETKKVDDYI